MLLNEFLKEHKAFIQEQNKVSKLQATVAQQQKQIEALTAGLQKVSAQLEVSRSAPKTVLNSQQKRRRTLRHELGNRYAVACLGNHHNPVSAFH